jgi:hypothetical protein
MVEILKGIRQELVDSLEHAPARGFEAVTRRLEHIVELSGERWRDREGRWRRIEERLELAHR